MTTRRPHFGPDLRQREDFRDQVKHDVFLKLNDHVTGVNFMFALQCGKQSKSERFRPIVFDKIINKRRNPLFIAMTAKKGPRKEIGRNCLLICVAKRNLNCLKPKTRLLLIYATCQIYVSDMLQIACLEMY